ncbi:MAG TPA: hypothetical protein VNU01_12820 [Egibacteraceae bacterium]|nr:hypothetical protein [Egibacteraceae bacterium]
MPPSADAADRGTPHAAAAGWRLLGVERGEPAALLARGLELLDGLSPGDPPVLRWYVPSAPALVLGRGQRDTDVRTDLPVARRHSGGGAVLMDADLLSLDVVFPAGHPMAAGDLGEAFLRVGEAWAAALGDLGVTGLEVHRGASPASRLGGPRERLLAAVCYALPGRSASATAARTGRACRGGAGAAPGRPACARRAAPRRAPAARSRPRRAGARAGRPGGLRGRRRGAPPVR